MKKYFDRMKEFWVTLNLKKPLKIIGFCFIGLFALLLVFAIGLRIYFERNKTEIIAKINTQINDNILGEARIGDIEYKFLVGFPAFTLAINQVEIRDNSWQIHKRSLLKAKEIELRLNVLSLLKNEVSIHKIVIHDATIDLFKDKNGNVNSDIFKPKKTKTTSSTTTSIDEVDLQNVVFISENLKGKKLFHFEIESLKSKIDFDFGDWKTIVKLKLHAKSMSFNINRGSFIEDQIVQGYLEVNFSEEQNKISIDANNLKIGTDLFDIGAHFSLAKNNALFDLDIRTKILWKNASNLLAKNISSRLNLFDLQIPLQANCTIKGDMNSEGDPEIVVNAVIKDDELTTSYGVVKKCSFNGKYTNNFKKGQPFTDANSAIVISDFKGEFNEIPLRIPLGFINNFDKPVATGKFNSKFNATKLKNTISEDFMQFTEGKVNVNVDFKVNIVDFKLEKPLFVGDITIDKTSFYYKPKNIYFDKTDVNLFFTEEALFIKKIKLQSQKNTVLLEGRVDNFLNLYYDAPEKMTLNWKVYSPYLDVKEIIGVLSYRNSVTAKSKKKSSSLFEEAFDKSKVFLDFKVDKLEFNKITAKDLKVTMQLLNTGLYVKNGYMKGSSGSTISFDGQLIPKNDLLHFKTNIKLNDGVISSFLASFDNFGVKSFKPKDIQGKLSFDASLSGTLNSKKDLIHKSLGGNFNFQIENGALNNFEPIEKIGKYAFPNRNVSHIQFTTLKGITTIQGDKIKVKQFKVSSNVLNMDVEGVYSLSNQGTDLGVRIPLRNPKDDYKIKNKKERDSVRYRGIVLSLLVVDDENGKTKIKLGKHNKE